MPQEAVELVRDPHPAVRAAALGALARLDMLDGVTLAHAAGDPEPEVRRRACLLAGRAFGAGIRDDQLGAAVLDRLASDGDASVVETAAWALGEAGSSCPSPGVDALVATARTHPDPLCREAAVAALGSIGDLRSLDAVIEALDDRVAVRRRAAVALAAFDDPRGDDALRRCLTDRDWQVRQAAEDLLGR
jgi:HEAT repeat protein